MKIYHAKHPVKVARPIDSLTYDNSEEYYDCDDADLEMGFDPYEGCYTFDC